VPVPARV